MPPVCISLWANAGELKGTNLKKSMTAQAEIAILRADNEKLTGGILENGLSLYGRFVYLFGCYYLLAPFVLLHFPTWQCTVTRDTSQ